ncbi:unnamed protein product [Porites evermanni]|uniref:Conodipine-M alpha chain n=1 Tax=Porites evermanni TaxID=104178 RepID=A0ABN8LWN8_9CNID|nr:unnamed protein product [Porites evermanni]
MKKIPMFPSFSMMLLSLAQNVMSKEECYIKTNGCSVPGGLPFFYKTTFTPACVKHDVCYSCGQRFGWNRSGCDNTFKQDMYRLCEKQFSRLISWPTKYERCKFFADLYYKAVRTAGSLYWSNPSEDWCKNVCTEALGDPSKPLDV